METPWTLVNAHKVERDDTKLPTYLDKGDASPQQTGIPYCWGGFNDREQFIALSETVLSGNYTRYMAGNTNCTGYHKPGTIGLDCSGFVGLATGVRLADGSKPDTSRFLAFGHSVSLDQLELWDVVVSGGDHVMFYAGGYSMTQSHSNTNQYNTTHHWYGCIYCNYAENKEEHLMLLGACLLCNYEEGGALHEAPTPQEPLEELPEPEFLVLCAEPKQEEFFERIQW